MNNELAKKSSSMVVKFGVASAAPVLIASGSPILAPFAAALPFLLMEDEEGKTPIDKALNGIANAMTEVLGGIAGEAIDDFIGEADTSRNQDLARAFAAAYLSALKIVSNEINDGDDLRLKEQLKERLLLWRKRIARSRKNDPASLFVLQDNKELLIKVSENEIQHFSEAVRECLGRWLAEQRAFEQTKFTSLILTPESLPEPLQTVLVEKLVREIPIRLGEVLKHPDFARAWIVFQREHLRHIVWVLKQLEAKNADIKDDTQLIIRRLNELGKLPDEAFKTITSNTAELLKQSLKQAVREEFRGKMIAEAARKVASISHVPEFEALPQPIETHLSKLQQYALKLMSDRAGKHIKNVSDMQQFFAPRRLIDPKNPKEKIVFPEAVLKSSELACQPGQAFDEWIIVGDAGEGKSTIVYWLQCELTQRHHVQRSRFVPMLALCVTLSELFVDDDDSKDAEALNKWLAQAIAPSHFDQGRPNGDAVASERKITEFVEALNRGGFRLLLIIDGFDELDLTITFCGNKVERMLTALHQWECRHNIQSCYRIATTRYVENIDGFTGMRRVKLQPPNSREIKQLAQAHGVPKKALKRFCEIFQDRKEIDSKFVYFHPLVRFFRTYLKEALNGKSGVSSLRLMEFEVDQAINEVIRQLRRHLRLLSHFEIEDSKSRLRNLFMFIALNLIDQHDSNRLCHLSRETVSKLVQIEDLSDKVSSLIESERVSSKILSVLIYAATGRRGERSDEKPLYRLPHNEYRDFLLADGLFRQVCRKGPIGESGAKTIVDLTRTYFRTERVSKFLHEMIRRAVSNPQDNLKMEDFSRMLIDLMNNRLPNQDPEERTDCSPHGAMLSLLLELGPVPLKPALRTEGVNFQGAVAKSEGPNRIELPGNRKWAGAILREADLRGADLSSFDLKNANLDNAQLNGANLSDACLVGANMRNVAMGRHGQWPTVLSGAKFDDGKSPDSGADWFNYRFLGLKGYYCFYELEPATFEQGMFVAGSHGQLLLFDLKADQWRPIYFETRHTDDILDVSKHPTENLIVTTSRDGSVRIHKLPSDLSSDLFTYNGKDGDIVHPLEELCALTNFFPNQSIPDEHASVLAGNG